MKRIDMSFTTEDINNIKQMIDKKFKKFKSDPFIYSPSVYGIVGLYIDDDVYAVTNAIETMDYYGDIEDVAIFRIKTLKQDNIKSLIQNQTMIETPVNGNIKEIIIVNENQKLFKNDVQTYDVWLTRGIIIKLEDGLEISFEKNIWFSEDITIQKGYDLIKTFSPEKEFSEGWENNYRGECHRELLVIS